MRDNYTRGGERFIVVTDRISAFDRVLGTIPFKGQVLNRLAAWWFRARRKNVVPNHMLGVPDPNVLECVECEPILVEMVVRAYATGTTSTSLWTHYERGVRVFCGHRLPEGLKKHQKLPAPILTPTTKAPKGEHDVSGSREEILATGKVTREGLRRGGGPGDEALRGRPADLRRARAHPRRHEVRVRAHAPTAGSWSSTRCTRPTRRASGARAPTTSASRPGRIPSRSTRTSSAAGTSRRATRATASAPPMPDDVRVGAAERYIAAYEQITGRAVRPRHSSRRSSAWPGTSNPERRDEGDRPRDAQDRGARSPGRRRAARARTSSASRA